MPGTRPRLEGYSRTDKARDRTGKDIEKTPAGTIRQV
jgi:hypothetical protein